MPIQCKHKRENGGYVMKVKIVRKKKSREVLRCINVNLNSIITNQNILCLQLGQIIALLRKITR